MKSLDHYTRTNRLASAFIMALCLLCLTNGLSAERDGSRNSNDKPRYAKFVLARVRHVTRVKILKSNSVALRPGSVYDVITHFELLPGLRPRFIYQFLDNGLGASEPLYPLFQRGHQGSWFQVLQAAFSKQNRHINHFTKLVLPEGCTVYSLYALRHITEYPQEMFQLERRGGYHLIVVRLEYYERAREKPTAQCGRHRSNIYDEDLNPMKVLKKHARKAMFLSDFPEAFVQRAESHMSTLKHLEEVRGKKKVPRIDKRGLANNSVWYYPDGHSDDFGLNAPIEIPPLQHLRLPTNLVIPATKSLQRALPLNRLLSQDDLRRLYEFLSGAPTPAFDPENEPGNDVLSIQRLHDDSFEYVLTSGLDRRPLDRDIALQIRDPHNFKLVGIALKPFVLEEDVLFQNLTTLPQIRFVYQMMDPTNPDKPVEQLFFHLNFDLIDRATDRSIQRLDYATVLAHLDQIAARQDSTPYQDDLRRFIEKKLFATDGNPKPVEALSFSSALSGNWIFGMLTRTNNMERRLEPLRIVRDGVDVGYYSSVYDNDLFRKEAEQSEDPDRRKRLRNVLDDLRVDTYRDAKRMDPHSIDFHRVTCSQCHLMSARDGVHIAFNDQLDRRITGLIHASEFLYKDSARQLQAGKELSDSALFETLRNLLQETP